MADEKNLAIAKSLFSKMCDALDRKDCNYEKSEEDLTVFFTVEGDDIPIRFFLIIDADAKLIKLMSPLPFKMSEEKRMDGAIAACAASFGMADGSFDYNISNGQIVFRMTASFRESLIGEELFLYMVGCSYSSVRDYNYQFLAVDKGIISIKDFIEKN